MEGNGIERIAAERKRQVEVEGWTPEHDDHHHTGSMARAAACYAAPILIYRGGCTRNSRDRLQVDFVEVWPWDAKWDKRSPRDGIGRSTPNDPAEIDARIRDLEKAGALCAAEIDRLLRHKEKLGMVPSCAPPPTTS